MRGPPSRRFTRVKFRGHSEERIENSKRSHIAPTTEARCSCSRNSCSLPRGVFNLISCFSIIAFCGSILQVDANVQIQPNMLLPPSSLLLLLPPPGARAAAAPPPPAPNKALGLGGPPSSSLPKATSVASSPNKATIANTPTMAAPLARKARLSDFRPTGETGPKQAATRTDSRCARSTCCREGAADQRRT